MTDPVSGVSCARARQLAADGWGFSGEAEDLVGFADFNFRITTDRGDRFVLKIAPPGTSLPWLQCQISALLHLAAGPLKALVPRVVPTRAGEVLMPVDGESDEPRLARLMTYLEGTPLAAVAVRPPSLLTRIGRTLARLDLALADFDHPGAHREFDWDLTTTPKHLNLTTHIGEPTRRALVEAHLERFEATVAPCVSYLEHAVIHNDGNDYNLLVADDGDPTLAGVIDFGDLLYTATIAELAIACAYLMVDRDDPWDDAAHLIRGYDSVRPLTRLEKDLLPDLVIGRLCTSLLFSAYGRTSNPDNAYLQISEAPMWGLLESPFMTDPQPNAKRCGGRLPMIQRSTDEILAVRRRHLGRNLSVSYSEPLKIVRGEGQYLFDDQGRRYLDLVNNVCHVGHCHPHVVAAGQRQMAELNTNTRYLHDNLADYALKLTATFPDPLSVVFFVCTGTEANDLALRLARTHTSTKQIIVLEHAYHGHSPSLIEIGTYKCEGPGG